MNSPPIDKSMEGLHPMFRAALGSWLAEAATTVKHVEFRITEGRRTLDRQKWLYAQGRTAPHERSPVVTWTLDSRHRWGLAADLVMIRKSSREAIWEVSSWRWLYKVVPPEHFGLRSLAPREWVHLEFRYADEAIEEAKALDLYQT